MARGVAGLAYPGVLVAPLNENSGHGGGMPPL